MADREEFQQLESVNAKTCGAFSGESWRGSASAVLAVGFLSGKNCWDPLQSSLLGSLSRCPVMKAVGVHSIHKGC